MIKEWDDKAMRVSHKLPTGIIKYPFFSHSYLDLKSFFVPCMKNYYILLPCPPKEERMRILWPMFFPDLYRTGGYKTCTYSDAVSKGREEIDETTVQHIKEQ